MFTVCSLKLGAQKLQEITFQIQNSYALLQELLM